jgi:hypothetical protein
MSDAQLVRYKAAKRKAKVNKVKFGGETYDVSDIGANAFNTAAGHKVTSIKLGESVTQIGRHAFFKTTSLKKLDLNSATDLIYYFEQPAEASEIFNKAFSKCGKMAEIPQSKSVNTMIRRK